MQSSVCEAVDLLPEVCKCRNRQHGQGRRSHHHHAQQQQQHRQRLKEDLLQHPAAAVVVAAAAAHLQLLGEQPSDARTPRS